MGGGHGGARPVIALVLILLSPVLFVSFILFYLYILYRCKPFLFPCGWILLCFHGFWIFVLRWRNKEDQSIIKQTALWLASLHFFRNMKNEAAGCWASIYSARLVGCLSGWRDLCSGLNTRQMKEGILKALFDGDQPEDEVAQQGCTVSRRDRCRHDTGVWGCGCGCGYGGCLILRGSNRDAH